MDRVELREGRLIVPVSSELIGLPVDIGRTFLDAVFGSEPCDLGHISNLYRSISQSEKDRFEKVCAQAGPDYAKSLSLAAANWSSVGTSDGTWELKSLKVVVKRDVHSWLIDHLYADSFGIWYAECRNEKSDDKPILLSDAEFKQRYGESIAEHLRKVPEFLAIRINQMTHAMESEWSRYRVTLMREERIYTETALGPPGIPPDEWLRPVGTVFVSAERIDSD